MPTAQVFNSCPPFPDNVPIHDLSVLSYRSLLDNDPVESEKLFQACVQTGFFLLDLRGATEGQSLLNAAEGVLKLDQNLSDLSFSEKKRYTAPSSDPIFGWKGFGAHKIKDGRADRCEFYGIRQDWILDNASQHHPPMIVAEKPLLKSFTDHAHHVCTVLFSHLDSHLGLGAGTLASLHATSQLSRTIVRLLHTSPQPIEDRQTSLFGHTDNGSVAVLFNIISGLQILPPGVSDEESNWRWVRPMPGCAVVNLGDALVQWSGGLLKSNMHRVVNPEGAQANSERYSFAYVLKPNNNVSMRELTSENAAQQCDEENFDFAGWHDIKSESAKHGQNLIRIKS